MYRIFLVEDDHALAAEICKQLECCGNETSIVSDFHAVTEEVKSYDPSLVLMDIMLPFQNGYYWTQEIRKLSSVPIVFLSSASDNTLRYFSFTLSGCSA